MFDLAFVNLTADLSLEQLVLLQKYNIDVNQEKAQILEQLESKIRELENADKNDGNEPKFKVLTDILGDEDHHGDMDFKVTGTKDGITALQLDNKVAGLTSEILKKALIQAKEARMHILGVMKEVIDKPRSDISPYAPRVMTTNVAVEKIGDVIGPSGKIIKNIIATFDVEVDIDNDSGKTFIYGKDMTKVQAAFDYIQKLVRDYQAGDIVSGKIFRIEAYGAFVKIEDGEKEGMIHISNLSNKRIAKVEDVVKMGEIVQCKIVEVNEKGQLALALVGVQKS